MECCVEQLFRLPTTRILAWNICWLALLPEPIGITSCKPTPRTYPHDAELDYFRVATIRPEQLRENVRKPTELICPP
jgi:hypothetical protein